MLSAAGSLQWLHDTIAKDVPFDALVAEAEAALEAMGQDLGGWRLVTLHYLRSRVVREPQARSANGAARRRRPATR